MNRNLRRNPVAQAISKQKLNSAITKQKIALYMGQRGENMDQVLMGIAMTLSMLGLAAELDPKIPNDDPKLRVLQGGLSACKQCLEVGWDPLQARAIDVAFDAALNLNNRIKDEYVFKAYLTLSS